MTAMTGYIERAFDRADASVETRSRADDGAPAESQRIHQHHPRSAGRRFRAEKDFPADDSGDGFDNIGDVLTVSPLLMERYLSAAERIARWAISTDDSRQAARDRLPRARAAESAALDRSTIEAEHRVEFDGEYIVRFGLPGERRRSKDSTPRRSRSASGWTASCCRRQIGRDQAVRAGLLQSVFRRRDAARICPKAITCSAPGSSTTSS